MGLDEEVCYKGLGFWTEVLLLGEEETKMTCTLGAC